DEMHLIKSCDFLGISGPCAQEQVAGPAELAGPHAPLQIECVTWLDVLRQVVIVPGPVGLDPVTLVIRACAVEDSLSLGFADDHAALCPGLVVAAVLAVAVAALGGHLRLWKLLLGILGGSVQDR